MTLFKSLKSPLFELLSEFLPLLVLSATWSCSDEKLFVDDDSLVDTTEGTTHNSDICKKQ